MKPDIADPPPHCGDLAQAVTEQAAVQRRQLRHGDDVSRGVTRGDLLDLMSQPQALQHREHVAQGAGVTFAQCAGVPADVTPAANPPQRARFTIGVTAWFFRSNVPPRRDTTSRSERVFTLPDSAFNSCNRNASGYSSRTR